MIPQKDVKGPLSAKKVGWARGLTLVITTLWRLRQEDNTSVRQI